MPATASLEADEAGTRQIDPGDPGGVPYSTAARLQPNGEYKSFAGR